MGFSGTGDVNSKYALDNFRVPNAADKKMKRLAIGGGVVLLAWVVGIGAFAVSRFQSAQGQEVATKTPEQAVTLAAAQARVAPAAPPTTPVAAIAAVDVVAQTPPEAKPLAAVTQTNTKSKSHKAAKSKSRSRGPVKRHAASGKRYAATTAKPSPSGQARMKDDQLDALLKQFK